MSRSFLKTSYWFRIKEAAFIDTVVDVIKRTGPKFWWMILVRIINLQSTRICKLM